MTHTRTTPAMECAKLVTTVPGVAIMYLDGPLVLASGPPDKSKVLSELLESKAKYWPVGSVDFYYLPDPREGFVWMQDDGRWRLITTKGRQTPLRTV